MDVKKLIGMAVVLVVLAGGALWQKRGELPRRAAPSPATLLAGVDLNALTQLEVTQGTNRAVLLKKDGVWTVESLFGYPADFSRLADALRKAAEVKTGSPVRSGDIADSEYGLDESAKTIELKTGDGKTAARIRVGSRRSASSGWANEFYIRENDSPAIRLVDYDFRPFSEKPADWIRKELLRVPSDDVVAVDAGGVTLKLDGADWTLTGLNKDTEELQTAEANRLRSALQALNCSSVAGPAAGGDPFESSASYAARTKDGLVYTLRLGSGDSAEGRPVRIAVTAEGGDDASAEKAAKLNAQLSGWTYILSSYSADSLMASREKLVKAKSAEAPESPAEAQ